MKANPWITYRTRFLVQAKQLTTSLAFTDVLGRQHSGRKGDYLVESSDGVLRIAPRQIFEDVYVPLFSASNTAESRIDDPQPSGSEAASPQATIPPHHVTWRSHPARRQRRSDNSLSLPPHLARKSPQRDPGRRTSLPGVGSF